MIQKTEHKKTKKYTEKQKNIASDRKKYRTIHGYYDLQKRQTALHLRTRQIYVTLKQGRIHGYSSGWARAVLEKVTRASGQEP